jgi:hypothetical protein
VCARILSAPSTSSRFTFFGPSTFTLRTSGRSFTRKTISTRWSSTGVTSASTWSKNPIA